MVMSALIAAGIAPTRLELEVTESVLLENTETTLRTLRRFRELGIRICLDDFGTGYSSLSYLRSFPFDKIKIDRSFVQEVGLNAHGAGIVQAVASLGASLGMETTAEGVETAEQLNLVRAKGCTEAQGFYFSPARPAAELADAVRRVYQGLRVVDPGLAAEAWSAEPDPLTDRERQILQRAGDGRSSTEIAGELHLSEGTVRNYLSDVIAKLGAANRVDAARIARTKGWL